VPHAAKAAVRAASTTVTGGLANPLLSVLEDAISIVTFILAVLVPLLVVALLGVTLYLASRWLRRHRATAPAA
jgi:small basic protein